MDRVCAYCGKDFNINIKVGRKNKFCSKKCRNQHSYKNRQNKITEIKCQYCGKYLNLLQVQRHEKYCSHECGHLSMRSLKNKVFNCVICNSEFIPKYKNQKCCSNKCGKIFQSSHKKPTIYQFICQNCGEKHSTSYKDRLKYCSRECSDAHIERRNCKCCGKEFDAFVMKRQRYCSDICRQRGNRRKHNNTSLDAPLPGSEANCIVCGKIFVQKTYKQITCGSKDCQTQYGNQLSKDNYYKSYIANYVPKICICKECGREFITEYLNKHRTFCSDKCMKKYGRRVHKATRRARIMNALRIDYFDPFYIFKRDKWHCQLCGVKTPKKLRGTIDNNAPELDHIVPLALGGEHTIANAQCLCRKCNEKKGATIAGQLRII